MKYERETWRLFEIETTNTNKKKNISDTGKKKKRVLKWSYLPVLQFL